jgi:DNA-binding beta-propeller fold protein YncE
VLAFSAGAGDRAYQVQKKIPLGGDGGWDGVTVDSESRRLYVARSPQVMVADLDTGRVLGSVPGQSVHAIALAPEFKHGFASNGKDDSVTMFDLPTFAVLKRIPTGKKPDTILFDADSKKILLFNAGSHEAAWLDAATGETVRTLPLGGRPEYAVADGQGQVYVNLKDKHEVAEIDCRNFSVTRRFALAPGEKPTGLAMDPVKHRLFSSCRNHLLIVVDIPTGKVLAAVPIGAGGEGCVWDASAGLVFCANGWDGTVSVVRENAAGAFEAVQTIPTQRGARSLALDAKTHSLYLPTAQLEFPPPDAPEPSEHKPKHPPVILKDTFVVLAVGP